MIEFGHIDNAGDLKTALNVIPDLRNPNMELGLSVDLTWNTGISFDISIGGSN